MPKMLKTTNVQDTPAAAVPGMQRIVRGYWARFRTWHSERAASRSLSALSDFELKDIGLHRSEIGSVLRDAERRLRLRRP